MGNDYVNRSNSKWTGKTVEINGNNITTYECDDCGSDLKYREFIEATGLCYSCKRKGYNRGQHKNKMRGGNNNIDKILTMKLEETN